MAGKQEQQKTAEMADLVPALAMAALSKGDDAVQVLMKELVTDMLEERRAKKTRKEAFMKNAVKHAQEDAAIRSREKAMCSHRNPRGETRLRGQYLSGTKQLCLVCTFCGDEFHRPAREGQKTPPEALMPSADVIGG